MSRLKGYLPYSAMQLMYGSLISHLLYEITCWGFECERLLTLEKRTVKVMINSKYNAYTRPLLKMKKVKIDSIFDIQCMKFWYKFTNGSLPIYFAICLLLIEKFMKLKPGIETSCIYIQTRRAGAQNVLRNLTPKLLVNFLIKSLNRLKHTVYLLLSTTWNVILLIHIVQVEQ